MGVFFRFLLVNHYNLTRLDLVIFDNDVFFSEVSTNLSTVVVYSTTLGFMHSQWEATMPLATISKLLLQLGFGFRLLVGDWKMKRRPPLNVAQRNFFNAKRFGKFGHSSRLYLEGNGMIMIGFVQLKGEVSKNSLQHWLRGNWNGPDTTMSSWRSPEAQLFCEGSEQLVKKGSQFLQHKIYKWKRKRMLLQLWCTNDKAW